MGSCWGRLADQCVCGPKGVRLGVDAGAAGRCSWAQRACPARVELATLGCRAGPVGCSGRRMRVGICTGSSMVGVCLIRFAGGSARETGRAEFPQPRARGSARVKGSCVARAGIQADLLCERLVTYLTSGRVIKGHGVGCGAGGRLPADPAGGARLFKHLTRGQLRWTEGNRCGSCGGAGIGRGRLVRGSRGRGRGGGALMGSWACGRGLGWRGGGGGM